MKEEILSIAVQYWKENSAGISAWDVAERLSISHQEALRHIYILRDEGKGTLNENVELYPISYRVDRKNNFVMGEKGEQQLLCFSLRKEF